MTDKSIAQILGVLTAAFPNNKVGVETLKVYSLTLADIPLDVLEAATLQIITTAKFFPTVSEIRDAAHAIMLGLNKIPSAFEAWQEAIEHCRQSNYDGYSHPLIERAVKVIGIPYWQSMETDDEMATRAQFIRVYESLFNRAVDDTKMLPRVKEFSANYQLLNSQVKLLADKMNINTRRQQ